MIRLTVGTVYVGLILFAVAVFSRGCGGEEKPVGPPSPLRLSKAYMAEDSNVRLGVDADVYLCFDRALSDGDWKGDWPHDSWWGLTYTLTTKQGHRSEHDDTPRGLLRHDSACYWLTSEKSLHLVGTRWVSEEERILHRGAVELRVWLWRREFGWAVVDSARYGL